MCDIYLGISFSKSVEKGIKNRFLCKKFYKIQKEMLKLFLPQAAP